jgi:hypothetical protein
MKKITSLLFCFLFLSAFSQSKSTGDISFSNGLTANFTLNKTTAKVTLVLKGPSDRWFGLGLGVQSGFNMSAGDVLVYTTSLTDRNFVGKQSPANDVQDWTTVGNPSTVAGVITLTLERNLENSDSKDLQLPYDTTNSINLVGVRADSVTTSLSSNHDYVYGSGSFNTVLGVEDFSLNATSIYPNPASGAFYIKTKTNVSKVNLYNQTGALVRTINVTDDSKEVELSVSNVQAGVYFLELQNDSEKSWKKVIVN